MADAQRIQENAERAATFLKALTNSNRLLILCQLAEGELSVGALEQRLGLRQPTLSQQLARLRADDLVRTRRDGKAIYYRLASPEVLKVISVLYEIFCVEHDGSVETDEEDLRAAQRFLEPAV
ncbi:MAG: metalloregulator ArsR/SmtB family transcription factor [Geminicoccaceae bacterium]